ncbi:MAG: hypothetical protein H0W00_04690 [Chloroflexi bacterium]|nr:hypothetical protein [Chloroflexota bacterium]
MTTHRSTLAVTATLLASLLISVACASDPVDPSVAVSAAPSASPEATPDDSLGLPRTPEPAPSDTPAASASPSARPSEPPRGDALFSDDFGGASRPLWGTGSHPSGNVSYADGALRIDLDADLNSLWSWRAFQPEQSLEVVLTEGTVATSGSGAAGWICGLGEDRFVGGLIHASGEWIVVDITDSTSSALGRGPLPEGVDPAAPLRLSVECTAAAAGPMRVRLLVDGLEVGSAEGAAGLSTFDRVGAYAYADVAGYAAAFDDVAVFRGGPVPASAAPSPSP